MKRFVLCAVTLAFFGLGFSLSAGAQSEPSSLGDLARSIKKEKGQETKAAAKVYDNDNLPPDTSINVVGTSPSAKDGSTDANSSSATDNKGNAGDPAKDSNATKSDSGADSKTGASTDDPAKKITPGQSQQERQKAYDAWKQQIDDQRKKIDQLSKDLDDFQHSTALPWPNNDKYVQGLADKQKALDQAKANLNDMQEQARKAGVPSSVIE